MAAASSGAGASAPAAASNARRARAVLLGLCTKWEADDIALARRGERGAEPLRDFAANGPWLRATHPLVIGGGVGMRGEVVVIVAVQTLVAGCLALVLRHKRQIRELLSR